MNSEKFFTWCRVAVKGIKYRPDRDAVHEELYEHLEDRYESFRRRGLEHEEAIDKTVEAMGSAEELAPLLAKAHRPFWPYTLRVSRILLIIVIIIMSFPFELDKQEYLFKFNSYDSIYAVNKYDIYADLEYYEEYYDEYYYRKRILYLEPNCSAEVDGYTFCVTNAAWWRIEHSFFEPEDQFYFRIKVTKPFLQKELANIVDYYFWAEDSLGNHYNLARSRKRIGLSSYVYDFCLPDYLSQDAQWIDLHYDRDGRNLVLRIDLTGGENP